VNHQPDQQSYPYKGDEERDGSNEHAAAGPVGDGGTNQESQAGELEQNQQNHDDKAGERQQDEGSGTGHTLLKHLGVQFPTLKFAVNPT
jgi:hypothetical protein